MTNKIVTVIIVTCGKLDYVSRCLDSIRKQSYKNLEAIVINNAYNQKFEEMIAGAYPEVSLYSNYRNPYYCPALNLGISKSRGEFVLCLNDDVILDEGFIEIALKGFSINDKIGMVSGKLLRGDRKTIDTSTSLSINAKRSRTIDSAGLFLSCWRTAKERGYGSKDRGQFEKEQYLFGVNGAAAFYRKKMLDKIKLGSEYFDSDFRIFYEDLDIAWRSQNSGWRGYYISSAIAYHIRGGTVRTPEGLDKPYARRYLSDDLHVDLIKNRYFAIIKNETLPGLLTHFPSILLYDLVIWSYLLFFRPRLIKPFLAALKDYVKPMLRKRELQRLITQEILKKF